MNDLFDINGRDNTILEHLDDDEVFEKKNWAKGLNELSDTIRVQLRREGMKDDEETWRMIERVLLAMSFICGGHYFYLPSGEKIKKALRNKRIYESFKGDNILELSRIWGLTPNHIYRVISKQKKLSNNKAC